MLRITTSWDESNAEIVLSVRDAGAGFEPENHERLYQPFYSTKDEGMGIGLSISRSIIGAHGGRLWAVLNDPPPGATFLFSVPCKTAALRATAPRGALHPRRGRR